MGEPEENALFVPWHRVVSGSGVISARGSVGAVRRQEDYLRAEGVEVSRCFQLLVRGKEQGMVGKREDDDGREKGRY